MNYSFLQWVILAAILVPSVITDIKECKICLGLIVAGMIVGIIYTCLNGMPKFTEYFLRFFPGIAILTAAYLIKGCIGIGDGLICIFLATVLEPEYLYSSIAAGFILAAVIGVTLVIFKKKTGKSKLPFVPFLSAGVVICGII